MYRVLKDNRYLSLTFHNRDIRIWEIVISNLQKIGFKLENIVYQEQAVSSGTQGLNRKNTLNLKNSSFMIKNNNYNIV